jgi:hypothetical protein
MNIELCTIIRQLDSLCSLADRVGAGARRDSIVRRIERLNLAHHLLQAKLAAGGRTV